MDVLEYTMAVLLVGARFLLFVGVVWIAIREIRKSGREKKRGR